MPDSSFSSSPDPSLATDPFDHDPSALPVVTSQNSKQPLTPRQFHLQLSRYEFDRVMQVADRMADQSLGSYSFVAQFESESLRRWVFRSQHGLRWLDEHDVDQSQPECGQITLSYAFMVAIRHQLPLEVVADYDNDTPKEIHFVVNLDAKTITYINDDTRATFTLPFQRKDSFQPRVQHTSHITVAVEDLVKAGSFLIVNPGPYEEEYINAIGVEPFVTCTFQGHLLLMTRDWTRFTGPVVTTTVRARGTFSGDFSMHALSASQDFFFLDTFPDNHHMDFTFSNDEPNMCELVGKNLGFRFAMQDEHVFEHRTQLEVALTLGEHPVEVERDINGGAGPVIKARTQDRDITVTIIPATAHTDAYVRISTVIAAEIEWTQQLGTEVNAWNDAWNTVKLVYVSNSLCAVADVSHSSFTTVADVVHDLVRKATIVDDFIGAVL